MSRTKTPVGGLPSVIEMLQLLEPEHQKKLLTDIAKREPELAAKIQEALFTFEDLAFIRSEGMQALVREVPTSLLALALRGAPEALKSHIFANTTARAGSSLKEELELAPKQRLSDVRAAQTQILDIAKRLESEGKLLLKK